MGFIQSAYSHFHRAWYRSSPIYSNCAYWEVMYPKIWQKTNVVFIPKPGKQNYYDSKSFRPISLTCFLLKALERCVELYLKSHILPKTPIHPNQHAYTADKSTDTALHCLVGKLENMLHHKHSALCTFLDIQGAFDHTTPTSIQKALQTHNTPQIIIIFLSYQCSPPVTYQSPCMVLLK